MPKFKFKISENLFCQGGFNNNKFCDNSKDDPTPEQFPISEANIEKWKSDALEGETINGMSLYKEVLQSWVQQELQVI